MHTRSRAVPDPRMPAPLSGGGRRPAPFSSALTAWRNAKDEGARCGTASQGRARTTDRSRSSVWAWRLFRRWSRSPASTLPLPEVVYRIAVELGTVVDAADPFDGGSDLRTTPLTGDVVLTPAERAALRAERRRAAARGPVQSGVTTTRRPARHHPKKVTARPSVASTRPGSSAHASAPHSSPPAERPPRRLGRSSTRCARRNERHHARRRDEARGRRRDEARDRRRDGEE